jgi:amino acid adenylation domain-containing protein
VQVEYAHLVAQLSARLNAPSVAVEVAAWCSVVARQTGSATVWLELHGDVDPLAETTVAVETGNARTFADLVEDLVAVRKNNDNAAPPTSAFVRGSGAAVLASGGLPVLRLTEVPTADAGDPNDAGMGAILIGQFIQALRSAVIDPVQPVSEFNIVSSHETALISQWNETHRDYPLDSTFIELFRNQVERAPERIAMTGAEGSLTYSQLLARADEFAERLCEAGAVRDSIVCTLIDRGLDAGVSMTGTLAAGAAFLALDPRNPPARLAHVLERSRPVAVIVADRYRSLLADAIAIAAVAPVVLSIGPGSTPAAPKATTRRVRNGSAGDLAYGVTTSGTTGVPKVALVEQRGFVNHCYGMIDELGMTSSDVLAQTAPLSFDIAVWQYLTPLLVGAAVVIVPDDVAANPAALICRIMRDNVTILQSVPSLLRAVLDVTSDDDLPTTLRWILATGEALPVGLAGDWLRRFPDRPLLNLYGPAECSDDTTSYVVRSPPAAHESTIPIGRPMPNIAVHVLDEHLLPMPIGALGEICLGGVGVGRGYCNDPERTAGAFVGLPGDPTTRVYRTGDMGRFRSDGLLEYHGRNDFQLKIRGLRIEAGEVETALDLHEALSASLVVGHGDGDARLLVAYVVPVDAPPTAEALRAHLSSRLPAFMIPALFVFLDQLPLTPNGKVDRRALPAPPRLTGAFDTAEAEISRSELTATEQSLTRLWREVLRSDRIDVDDNFFDSGGTSIIAAVLFWKMSRDLDIDLPLSTLIIAPTIRQLAERIDRRAEMPAPVLVPLQPNGNKAPLFLFHAQGGESLGYRYLAEHLDPTRPVYGLDPTRVRDRAPRPASMDAMVDRYLQVIRGRQPSGPYLLGGFCMGGAVAWATAQRLQREGDDVRLVVMLQSDHPNYPVTRAGASPTAVRWARLRQRVSFELSAFYRSPKGGRWDHVRVKVLGKLGAVITLPIERRIDARAAAKGRPYAGSERLAIDRWRRSDSGVYDGYEFTPYSGAVLQIRAERQPRLVVADPTLGWGPLLMGPRYLESVPGEHLEFLSRQAPAIAAIVNRHLACIDP